MLAGLALLPLLGVIGVALRPADGLWGHLWQTLLPGYVWTSVLLALGVMGGCLLLGIGSAWLVSMCDFFGRRWLEVGLLLPLAMPGYLAAFIYTELLDYAGPLQRGLRAVFGWENGSQYWFPEVRSIWGAVLFLSLTLYPYVFLLSRAAFVKQYAEVFEAGRSLGGSPWRCFWSLSLPLARPAILAGATLSVMEALSDFGVVELFAVPTFTVGVYRVWFAMGNPSAAAQLALLPLGLLLLLGWWLAQLRLEDPLSLHGMAKKAHPPFRLTPLQQRLAFLACAVPVILGFLLPVLVLGQEVLSQLHQLWSTASLSQLGDVAETVRLTSSSLLLSLAAMLVCTGMGVLIAYGIYLRPHGWRKFIQALVRLSYATPGVVLAIGILLPLTLFDKYLAALTQYLHLPQIYLLSGSLLAILLAYYARFLSLSLSTVRSGLSRVDIKLLYAARSLGAGSLRTLWQVHRPILRNSILVSALLVFIDAMKELPMTLILRPFNFDTLATRIFEHASSETFAPAALSALILILATTIPVLLLHKNY